MNKLKIRQLIWGLLITVSLLSYLYLNSPGVKDYVSDSLAISQSDTEVSEEEMEPESKIFLLDIALMKKILDTAKTFLPSE
jgi:hypothetical protein